MDSSNLKYLLQHQLSTDSNAVLHLSSCIHSLFADSFSESPHLSKWTARIHSLMHSKEQGARWAGFIIAHRTAILSQTLMMECAQAWISIAIPLLSRNENVMILRACIRLLLRIFSGAIDVPEFQRQMSTPNVPKYTLALISLTHKHPSEALRLDCIKALTKMVPLYPTLHRTQLSALQGLTTLFLQGQYPPIHSREFVVGASELYASLPVTAGKVGAPNAWRKSMDESVSLSRTILADVRTSYNIEDRRRRITGKENPRVPVPLNLDRLKCTTLSICHLLTSNITRAIALPLGTLTTLIIELLQCTKSNFESLEYVDPSIYAEEAAAVPIIWSLGSELLLTLLTTASTYLTSTATEIVGVIVYQLEQPLSYSSRVTFLTPLLRVMDTAMPMHEPLLITRAIKAILPNISTLLESREASKSNGDYNESTENRGKRSKKRAREYEGEEAFKASHSFRNIHPEEGSAILLGLQIIRHALRTDSLTKPIKSLTTKIILSLLLHLPQIPPTALSSDALLHGHILELVKNVCFEVNLSSTSILGSTLSLLVTSSQCSVDLHRTLDIAIHARVPPLVRSLPAIEGLSVYIVEEGNEESKARSKLGIESSKISPKTTDDDELMELPASLPLPPNNGISASSIMIADAQHLPQKPVLTQEFESHAMEAIPMITSPKLAEYATFQPVIVDASPLPERLVNHTALLDEQMPPMKSASSFATGLIEEDSEDEAMPTINMESDTDEESV